MTITEFNKTAFTGQMECIYQGEKYKIAGIDFEEKLIGIYEEIQGCENTDEISWKRCENVTIV